MLSQQSPLLTVVSTRAVKDGPVAVSIIDEREPRPYGSRLVIKRKVFHAGNHFAAYSPPSCHLIIRRTPARLSHVILYRYPVPEGYKYPGTRVAIIVDPPLLLVLVPAPAGAEGLLKEIVHYPSRGIYLNSNFFDDGSGRIL